MSAGLASRFSTVFNSPQPEVSPSDIGVLELSTGIFTELARRASALAPRVAAVLEGGYNVRTLPRLVRAAHEGFQTPKT